MEALLLWCVSRLLARSYRVDIHRRVRYRVLTITD